jgi:hypothetical protein
MAVLIYRAPQIMPLAVDGEEYLVEILCVLWPGTAAPELIGILLPEFATPLPDGLVGHDDAANEREFLHSVVAQAESVVEPDGVTDNLDREAAVLIRIDR